MRNLTKQRAAEKRKAAPERKAFLQDFPKCWTGCGYPSLAIHEMTPGAGRRRGFQERCTWIATCNACHAEAFQPFRGRFDLAGQLALKAYHDAEYYDRLRVLEIKRLAPTAVTEVEVIQAALGHRR